MNQTLRTPGFRARLAALGITAVSAIAASCGGSDTDDTWGGKAGNATGNGGSGLAGGSAGNAGSSAGNAGSLAGSAGSTAGNAGNAGSAAGSGGDGGSQAGSGGAAAGAGGGSSGSAGAGGVVKTVDCSVSPLVCADIGPDKNSQLYGCCSGNTVYWCDDESGTWELHDVVCDTMDGVCGYAVDYASVYCVEPPCTPGSCDAGLECVNGQCVEPPCTPTSCGSGLVCINEQCLPDPGPGPGPGPGPLCPNLPPFACTGSDAFCGELMPFDPDNDPDGSGYDATLGYVDYPVRGESWGNQSRSYLRRDLMMLAKYATAFVACKTAEWNTGNGMPLGLVDMSTSTGAAPGPWASNTLSHPPNTHLNGFDLDVAYYQSGTLDNNTRSVCPHTSGGQDVYHCTGAPNLLDKWRTALFVGALHEHPKLRVVGVDGKVGPLVRSSIARLCEDGWLSNAACGKVTLWLAYEETNDGFGWYLFHDAVMQVSF